MKLIAFALFFEQLLNNDLHSVKIRLIRAIRVLI